LIPTGHPTATNGEHLANEAARRIVAQVGGELRILARSDKMPNNLLIAQLRFHF
jgi:hypothetical protein